MVVQILELPDDPAAFRTAATASRAAATCADAWDQHVKAAVPGSWRGSAADAYDSSRQAVQRRWAAAGPAMTSTSTAILRRMASGFDVDISW